MTDVWDNADVKGGDMLVLLALADWANDDGMCFPAIPTIARRARMTGRNVQLCLRKLCNLGLVRIEDNAGPHGVNRYFVTARPDRDAVAAATTSSGGGEKFSPVEEPQEGVKNDAQGVKPASPGGEAGFTQTVIEPSTEPSTERERAIADDDRSLDVDDPSKFEKRVKRIEAGWPGALGSSTKWAVKQFAGLTDAERAAAETRAEAFLAACKRDGVKPPAVGVYFRDRKFADLPDDCATVSTCDPQTLLAPVYGPLWQAVRMRALLAGPVPVTLAPIVERLIAEGKADRDAEMAQAVTAKGWPRVNRMHDQARHRVGITVAAHLKPIADLCEPVEIRSDLFAAWRDEHRRRGWPWLPEPDGLPVVWFPRGGPDGLSAFEQAIGQFAQEGKAA